MLKPYLRKDAPLYAATALTLGMDPLGIMPPQVEEPPKPVAKKRPAARPAAKKAAAKKTTSPVKKPGE